MPQNEVQSEGNDWKRHKTGGMYLSRASETGRSGHQGRLDDRLERTRRLRSWPNSHPPGHTFVLPVREVGTPRCWPHQPERGAAVESLARLVAVAALENFVALFKRTSTFGIRCAWPTNPGLFCIATKVAYPDSAKWRSNPLVLHKMSNYILLLIILYGDACS